jgi:hypothetical protein
MSAETKRQVEQAVAVISTNDLARIVACAITDPHALRWAEVVWSAEGGEEGDFAGIREFHAGNDAPGPERTLDATAIRRGLRRAIESSIELQGVEVKQAINGHLQALTEPSVADRVIQFAIFESDTEVYYTGAGVES